VTKRFEIALPDAQFSFLEAEANRSSISIAELIRRAIDTTYGLDGVGRVHVITHTLGRRSGRRLDAPVEHRPARDA
jgi:hypothetical protein